MWLSFALCFVSCAASYHERLAGAHRLYYDGDPLGAAERLADLIVERRGEADADLLRLERASALAAAGRHAEAARAMADVDSRLEVLDYTDTPVTALSDLIFSTTLEPYRATRPEKVLINTLNMLNFVAAGDVESAAVEARRARVLLTQADLDAEQRYENPLTWTLAGWVLRYAGQEAEAVEAFAAAGTEAPPPLAEPGAGTLLIAVHVGRGPVRVEEFLTLHVSGRPRRLQWPALASRRGGVSNVVPRVSVFDAVPAPVRLDVEAQARHAYAFGLDRLLAAAAVQSLLRTGAADAASNDLRGDDHEDRFAEFIAWLAEWGLSELTPPDTRAWTLLPRVVELYAVSVPAGRHEVLLTGVGSRPGFARVVDVSAGELELVAFTTAVGEGYRSTATRRESGASTSTGLAALRAAESALALRHGGLRVEVRAESEPSPPPRVRRVVPRRRRVDPGRPR